MRWKHQYNDIFVIFCCHFTLQYSRVHGHSWFSNNHLILSALAGSKQTTVVVAMLLYPLKGVGWGCGWITSLPVPDTISFTALISRKFAIHLVYMLNLCKLKSYGVIVLIIFLIFVCILYFKFITFFYVKNDPCNNLCEAKLRNMTYLHVFLGLFYFYFMFYILEL